MLSLRARLAFRAENSDEGWQESNSRDAKLGDVHRYAGRLLLREIFTAAGGTHDNWDEYDRTMREQRRTAVLITPTRIYGS